MLWRTRSFATLEYHMTTSPETMPVPAPKVISTRRMRELPPLPAGSLMSPLVMKSSKNSMIMLGTPA